MSQPNTNTPEQSAPEIPKWFSDLVERACRDKFPPHHMGPSPCGQDYEVLDAIAEAKDEYKEKAFANYHHLQSQPIPSLGWVKASERLPPYGDDPGGHFRLNGRKVNGNFYDLPFGIGFKVHGGNHHDDYDIYPTHFDRLEWLEESLLPVQPESKQADRDKERIADLERILGVIQSQKADYFRNWRVAEKAYEDLNAALDEVWNTRGITNRSVDSIIKMVCQAQKKVHDSLPGQPSIEPDASLNDGWISVDTPPALMKDQTYSENVFVVWEGKVEVMAHCSINDGEVTGRVWCNCYGDIYGEPQYDADYHPILWRPIPKPPVNDGFSPEAREAAAISDRSLKYSLAKEKSDTDGLQS